MMMMSLVPFLVSLLFFFLSATTDATFLEVMPQRRVRWSSCYVCVVSPRRLYRSNKRSNAALMGTTRPDVSQEVQEAMDATKTYGPTSIEARVAWDIVEEMDASDSSPAIATTSLVEMSSEEVQRMDYYNQVHFLASLLQETKEKVQQMKALTTSIRNMELNDPSLAKLNGDDDIKKALAEAKAAMEVHGAGSVQASEAWKALEECAHENDQEECNVESVYRYSAAALKAHHYYNAVMDTTLLEEAMNAFDTIVGLEKFVSVEKSRLDQMKEQE